MRHRFRVRNPRAFRSARDLPGESPREVSVARIFRGSARR
jgi:hypothetical protein